MQGFWVLDNPDLRQRLLQKRLEDGADLIAIELASEFGVSIDTVRRDLIALEQTGLAKRVRGGAIPVATIAAPLRDRQRADPSFDSAMIDKALSAIAEKSTLLLDGGTTLSALARRLAPRPGRVVITPSPYIGAITHQNGIETIMIGGRLSELGGIAVGNQVLAELNNISGSVAILGVCGLDPEFGMSCDDFEENAVKRQLALSARETLLVADSTKFKKRARYRTIATDEIDLLITDAPLKTIKDFIDAGVTVRHG